MQKKFRKTNFTHKKRLVYLYQQNKQKAAFNSWRDTTLEKFSKILQLLILYSALLLNIVVISS